VSAAGGAGESYLSVLVFLLPYMEQDNIYKSIDLARAANWWSTSVAASSGYAATSNMAAASNRIKSFVCPSVNPYNATGGAVLRWHIYNTASPPTITHSTTGTHLFNASTTVNGQAVAATTYMGCAGLAGKGTGTSSITTTTPAM